MKSNVDEASLRKLVSHLGSGVCMSELAQCGYAKAGPCRVVGSTTAHWNFSFLLDLAWYSVVSPITVVPRSLSFFARGTLSLACRSYAVMRCQNSRVYYAAVLLFSFLLPPAHSEKARDSRENRIRSWSYCSRTQSNSPRRRLSTEKPWRGYPDAARLPDPQYAEA